MNAPTERVSTIQANRGTIFVEDATVLNVDAFPRNQYVLRLKAPKCANSATPGSFVHLQCDESIPMRRPVSSIGPSGCGCIPHPERPISLLIGGGVGIPPMIFLAEHLKNDSGDWQPLVIMGSEIPFPFELQESAIKTPWIAGDVASTMALLESWGIPARLASLSDFSGTYRGYVTELARKWLQSLSQHELTQVEVFSCGPTPMLKAVAAMAREFNLPCQISLEEFMACAVGGCAGCTVLVQTENGPAMKRVCVDGPVFNADAVYPE